MSMIARLFKSEDRSVTQSKLYSEETFYKAFFRDIKKSKDYVVIESPFITVKRASELASKVRKLVRHGVIVKIYTRNPLHHTSSLANQTIAGSQILKDAGARVILCDDMRHRKLVIIDGKILWEGSLNVLSQACSKEIMRRTQSEYSCSEMLAFTGLTVVS